MRKISVSYFLFCLLIITVLFSCVPQQKAVSHRKQLAIVDSQLQQYNRKLAALDAQRENKQELNEIDDTASTRIKKFIGIAKGEIEKIVAQNSIVIGETAIDRSDWERLKKALTLSQKSLKSIADKVSFIDDVIKRNTVVKLDQDVIFKPGQYHVSADVASAIGNFFEPAAKEIDYFVKKYPSFPLSLVITAKGYADGTSISETSQLYRDLKERLTLQTESPSNKELNKELSRARAEEVISLFKKFTTDRSADGGNIRNILYLFEGKGEIFPNPKIGDYKPDDPRRRVVLLFWSVFPE
jgi:hypothetical protein